MHIAALRKGNQLSKRQKVWNLHILLTFLICIFNILIFKPPSENVNPPQLICINNCPWENQKSCAWKTTTQVWSLTQICSLGFSSLIINVKMCIFYKYTTTKVCCFNRILGPLHPVRLTWQYPRISVVLETMYEARLRAINSCSDSSKSPSMVWGEGVAWRNKREQWLPWWGVIDTQSNQWYSKWSQQKKIELVARPATTGARLYSLMLALCLPADKNQKKVKRFYVNQLTRLRREWQDPQSKLMSTSSVFFGSLKSEWKSLNIFFSFQS